MTLSQRGFGGAPAAAEEANDLKYFSFVAPAKPDALAAHGEVRRDPSVIEPPSSVWETLPVSNWLSS